MPADVSLKSVGHEEMLEMFERLMKTISCFRGRLEKKSKDQWKVGRFYKDGEVNAMFTVYRMGVDYGIAVSQ